MTDASSQDHSRAGSAAASSPSGLYGSSGEARRVLVAIGAVGALLLAGLLLVGFRVWTLQDRVEDLYERVAAATERTERAEELAAAAADRATLAEASAREAARGRVAAQAEAAEAAAARQRAEALREEAAAAREAALEERQAAEERAARAETEARQAEEELVRLRREREAQLQRLQERLGAIADTRRTALGLVMSLGEEHVQFDFDEAAIRPQDREVLSRIAGVLMAFDGYHIQIHGHTDDVGTPEYNEELSRRRAAAVRDYFVEAGLDPGIITIRGFGEARPLVEDTSEEARQRNRRVEIGIIDTVVDFDRAVPERKRPERQGDPDGVEGS